MNFPYQSWHELSLSDMTWTFPICHDMNFPYLSWHELSLSDMTWNFPIWNDLSLSVMKCLDLSWTWTWPPNPPFLIRPLNVLSALSWTVLTCQEQSLTVLILPELSLTVPIGLKLSGSQLPRTFLFCPHSKAVYLPGSVSIVRTCELTARTARVWKMIPLITEKMRLGCE